MAHRQIEIVHRVRVVQERSLKVACSYPNTLIGVALEDAIRKALDGEPSIVVIDDVLDEDTLKTTAVTEVA